MLIGVDVTLHCTCFQCLLYLEFSSLHLICWLCTAQFFDTVHISTMARQPSAP